MNRRERLTAAESLLDDEQHRGADRAERALILAEAATHAVLALASAVGDIADTLKRANR